MSLADNTEATFRVSREEIDHLKDMKPVQLSPHVVFTPEEATWEAPPAMVDGDLSATGRVHVLHPDEVETSHPADLIAKTKPGLLSSLGRNASKVSVFVTYGVAD